MRHKPNLSQIEKRCIGLIIKRAADFAHPQGSLSTSSKIPSTTKPTGFQWVLLFLQTMRCLASYEYDSNHLRQRSDHRRTEAPSCQVRSPQLLTVKTKHDPGFPTIAEQRRFA